MKKIKTKTKRMPGLRKEAQNAVLAISPQKEHRTATYSRTYAGGRRKTETDPAHARCQLEPIRKGYLRDEAVIVRRLSMMRIIGGRTTATVLEVAH